MQISLSKKIKNSNLVAAKESRRRAQQVAFYEKSYLDNAVYPLLKQLSEGDISEEEANALLRQIHGVLLTAFTTNSLKIPLGARSIPQASLHLF